MSTVIKGACPHDCPDTCAWLVEVDNGRALSVRGDPAHPFTQGALCSKLKRYPARVYSPDRILYPLRRTGAKGAGQFERVSWDSALDDITAKLKETITEYGPLSVMPYSFAGTIGLLQRYAGEPFFAHLGATGLIRDLCGSTAYAGVASTIGAIDSVLPQDLVHSRFIIIWGTNTVTTNLHLWSSVIREARAAGAKVIAIDPLRTATAELADQHVQIKPGTDGALALGMMHVIVRDGLQDQSFIDDHTVGFAALCERLTEYPPARVAAITGISSEVIETLAHAYATTKPAVLRLSVGMERHSNGGMMLRTIACLPGLIGAWRERGGGICQFTATLFRTALNYSAVTAPKHLPSPARAVHLGQLGQALTAPDMRPPIKWLMIYNSNPMVTAPHQNLVRTGLAREDLFTVVHEQFMTDSARYADYILPATTQLEHLELMPSWGQTYLALNLPAIEPCGEALPNTELFRRLANRMGYTEEYLHRSDQTMLEMLLDSRSPWLAGITYARLVREGWAALALPEDWRPLAGGAFPTPSGKLEFYSTTLAAQGHDPLPAHVALDEDGARYPLLLMSAKHPHFLNSEYVNLRHAGTAAQVPKIQIHPDDAAARGIHDGARVRVYNGRGAVEVAAELTDDTLAGVVNLPFNWWPNTTHNNASANALTPDGVSDRGIGSNAFDARVEVGIALSGANSD